MELIESEYVIKLSRALQKPDTGTKNADKSELSGPPCSTIRDLMLVIERLRRICEHSEGADEASSAALCLGMSLARECNDHHKGLISDYQRDSFWVDVDALKVGQIEEPSW